MKWTALLAVAAFLLVAGSARAAPKAIRGVVVAKRAHSGAMVVATGRKGVAVTVHVAPSRVRLGDRVSVVGTHLSVLSRVKTARIRGVVVKCSGTRYGSRAVAACSRIHTRSRAVASHGDGHEGELGEFEVEFEHDGLFEHAGFTPVPAVGHRRDRGTSSASRHSSSRSRGCRSRSPCRAE